MKKHLILILIITVVLTGCKKYEVQYGTETGATTVLQNDVYDIAYSTEEGVFLLTTAMSRSKMLVSFANKFRPKAGRVALSPKKDKVAYVDPDNGVPVIVDTSGNVLAELTQYTNVNDLGWYNGDKTLYILSNNQVYFYGEALDLPNPLFARPSGANDYEVTSLDINDELDVAYGAIYYEFSGSYRKWYYSSSLNYKSSTLIDETYDRLYASYYYLQNVGADSKRYYHTIRFIDTEYGYGKEWVATATAIRTQSEDRFDGEYLFRKNGFELSIDDNGTLFKKAVSNNSNYPAVFWRVDIDYDEPLYVDWAIGF